MVDPTSSNFDPLVALYGETPSDPDVKPFDNIAMFEAHLKKTAQNEASGTSHSSSCSPKKKKKSRFSQRQRIADEVQSRDVSKLQELMEMRKRMDRGDEDLETKTSVIHQPKKFEVKKNVFTSMENLAEGPMSLLFQAVDKQIRCNVYVRDFCGLRGVCRGYVVAFDRFMNLAMIDIDETFRKPPLGKVKDHQKPITVSCLEEAFKKISFEGIEDTRCEKVKKTTECGELEKSSILTQCTEKKSSKSKMGKENKICVKRVGTEYFRMEKFSGGYPILYHRHLPQLLIKGDNIVLISLLQS